jgi:hypothetical protein
MNKRVDGPPMVQKSLLHQQINLDQKKTSGLFSGDGSSDAWGWERAVGPIKNYFFSFGDGLL